MAVLPSPDSATDEPQLGLPTALPPTSLVPCWLHTPPARVKTHAAPSRELSSNPPTMAVLPSPDSATDQPCAAAPTAPVPTSFGPSCRKSANTGCDGQYSAAEISATPNSLDLVSRWRPHMSEGWTIVIGCVNNWDATDFVVADNAGVAV